MEESQLLNGVVSDNKFFSRLLTKEGEIGCSARVLYYAAPGAVPFGWESEPGTPKHQLNSEQDRLAFPPLSPSPFLLAADSRSRLFLSESSPHSPLRLSRKISASNLSLKLSGALQIMKAKVRLLRSQHKVYAQIPPQEEECYIWKRRSKSGKKKSNDKMENMDISVCLHWKPFSFPKVLFDI